MCFRKKSITYLHAPKYRADNIVSNVIVAAIPLLIIMKRSRVKNPCNEKPL